MKEQILTPYLLGCLIGDGGLHGNLTFASLDQDIVERLNLELAEYDYYLLKRSTDPKRSSEYNIKPKYNNKIKYLFEYNGKQYLANEEFYKVLQADGYPVTNHDTLLGIVGKSTKNKSSLLNKYFPELQTKIICKQIKETQNSIFIDLLNKFKLRCKFDEKRIPEIYFNLSKDQRLELFKGLMDTDGSIGTNKRLEFCVANELLALDFAKLAESLGYIYKVYEKQPKYFNKKYNEIRLGRKAYRVLLNYNPSIIPFYCKRKLEMYNKNIGEN